MTRQETNFAASRSPAFQSAQIRFQSAPAFITPGNEAPTAAAPARFEMVFQSAPAFITPGNVQRLHGRRVDVVSIRPGVHHAGELIPTVLEHLPFEFQSAPAFITPGNAVPASGLLASR